MYNEERRQRTLQQILKKLTFHNLLQVREFGQAEAAYRQIHDHPEEVIQVVFSYQ